MKKGAHPVYRPVVFKDTSTGYSLLTRSTAEATEKIIYEGKEYPLIKMEISSDSHPFYTGKSKLLDTAGRVEKFNKKYAKKVKPTIKPSENETV